MIMIVDTVLGSAQMWQNRKEGQKGNQFCAAKPGSGLAPVKYSFIYCCQCVCNNDTSDRYLL